MSAPQTPAVGSRYVSRTHPDRIVTVTAEATYDGRAAVAFRWTSDAPCSTALPLDVFHRAYRPAARPADGGQQDQAATPGREQEIRARASAATPAPWTVDLKQCDCSDGLCGHGAYVSSVYSGGVLRTELGDFPDADWRFTLHAREDIPWLLDENARLREQLSMAEDRNAHGFREMSEMRTREASAHDDLAAAVGRASSMTWPELIRHATELRADRDAAVAAAVRRALEDAADVLEANAEEWDGWPDKQRVMRKDAEWLRTRARAVASPVRDEHSYRDIVNAPLTEQTVEALNERLEAGDMSRRKVASPARAQGEEAAHCATEYGGPGYTHCELPHGHAGQHESAMGNMRRATWGEEAER